MKIIVCAVGKVKDRPLRDAIDEYVARVRRYVAVDEVEIADGPPERVRAAFEKALAGATVVALEVNGKALSSPDFARFVERLGARGKGVVGFAIGGADGLPKEISAAAHVQISLSTFTFPHRLARLVLVEQLYRAMTILRNEPYAH
ncbi:MAG: 23S rRNA (pseudouridine(1915)-N(3))-methyltransferase RlmH [Polyangiaceae bacterium]|nr:23S rRNA (pseudouridine(1915)-N(3))-methyltransferase RlmH [Polyangiaceae bacterium]